jgi:transcriptional regulator with XRE-family HTH domain
MKLIANNYKANETFKFLRQGLDLTQEELAKNIKASKSSIEKYEYGTVNYTFETLLKIAEKYNLNIIIETKKQHTKSSI